MKTDHLMILTSAGLFDSTLTATTVPADDVGPTHKKYHYELPGGRVSSYGYTRKEALAELLARAKTEGWRVLQPLN
ncbi:MAG: hypothetical protein EKK47_18170 [Burkholderiales bacterium]|nr:MAG: hypothetical protein EKK47_18170 [Burkholderiales bacterium]